MGDNILKSCRLCESHNTRITYDGSMRHSGVGSGLSDKYRILNCRDCSIEFIDPFPVENIQKYGDGSYWKNKGVISPSEVERIYSKALIEQQLWLRKIGLGKIQNKALLDFGSGPGCFLAIVDGIAKETIGIEKDYFWSRYNQDRGHIMYESIEEAIENGLKVDIIVSFDVFEHLDEPIKVLSDLKKVLNENGVMYIGVPNQKDLIKELVPAYLSHFYHIEHLWYFESRSLKYIFQKAGFAVKAVAYLHKYNFLNLIVWARTGKAAGLPTSQFIDEDMDSRFSSWLEDRGLASHILVEAKLAGIK